MHPLEQDLFSLLNIPSETGHEQQITQWLDQRLAKIQRYRRVQAGQCRCYFAKNPQNLPTIALYGHTDTVKNQQEFGVKIEDNKIYGCGASDMKSGLAVMLHILEQSDACENQKFNLQFVFYDAEEGPHEKNGLKQALAEVPELLNADFAFVLEPTCNQVQAGCLGSLNVCIRFLGQSAHSARPWQGKNAIHAAAGLIQKVGQQERKTVLIQGLEFYEVSQITLATGGQGRNLVPAVFEMNLNHRFTPDQTVEQAWQNVQNLLGSEAELELIDAAPSGEVFMNNPFLSAFIESAKVKIQPKQAWTDVARLGQTGIQAVNFGGGDPSLAHQRNEYLDLAALHLNYKKLADYLII